MDAIGILRSALGRDLTREETMRVDYLFQALTAQFCREAATAYPPQVFRHLVKVDGGRVFLPAHPLRAVHALTTEDGEPVEYRVALNHLLVDVANHVTLICEYEAGWTALPDNVLLQLVDSAARLIRTSDTPAAQGAQSVQQSGGGYSASITYAGWTVGGQALLSPADIQFARSLRPRRRGHVWAVTPP